MLTYIKLCVAAGIAAALLANTRTSWSQPVPAKEDQAAGKRKVPDREDDVEVMPQGPIHEAYAQTPANKHGPAPIVKKPPPEPIPEEPPDQKPEGKNVQWIPGYWDWDQDKNDYIWVSGFWRMPPPGRKWIPSYWDQVEGGWQRVPGYWAPEGQEQPDYVPEPPESLEYGPSTPPPGDECSYIPGSWV